MVFCPRQLPNGWFSPNLATTRESMFPRRVSEKIFETFPFRTHSPPQKKKWRDQIGTFLQHQGHTTEILFTPTSLWSVFLYDVQFRSYEASVPQFSHFCPFSHIKTPKKYLPVTSLQLGGYIAECFRLLPPTKEEVNAFARVCLLTRLLKNACTDLDEILLVDRCRDMNELINFWARSGS